MSSGGPNAATTSSRVMPTHTRDSSSSGDMVHSRVLGARRPARAWGHKQPAYHPCLRPHQLTNAALAQRLCRSPSVLVIPDALRRGHRLKSTNPFGHEEALALSLARQKPPSTGSTISGRCRSISRLLSSSNLAVSLSNRSRPPLLG